MPKTLVCFCEDVTDREVRRAIRDGCRDLESLKRYLAVGTGACQSKSCVVALVKILEEETGESFEGASPFVARPPAGTPLAFFAAPDETEGAT